MKRRFVSILKNLGATGDLNEEYEKICLGYKKPPRAYHNINHVRDNFLEIDMLVNEKVDFNVNLIGMFNFYHDIIYDTKKSNNEELSADMLMRMSFRNDIDEKFSKKVYDMIIFSKHDKLPDSFDEAIALDIDLSILGKNLETFNDYDRKIREEYFWVSDELYKEGRGAFVKGMLNKKVIYGTEIFRDLYETNARMNLQRLLCTLE